MEKIKITKELLKILKAYTKLYNRIDGKYQQEIHKLEKLMQQETGIKDIAFVLCDGEFSGIGTPDEPTKMKLIFRNKLE